MIKGTQDDRPATDVLAFDFESRAQHSNPRVQFLSSHRGSLKRIAVSYALATGVGVLLGVAMGRSNIIRDIASPYIEILRPIPAVA